MIKVVYSQTIQMVDCRINLKNVNSQLIDVYERTMTYEGPSVYSRESIH